LFYWATVLATFAMGTATGDLTAKTLNLGYLASGIWFSMAFAAVAVAHWKFRLNPILAFWIAYVLTRPVGASFADYIAFPHSVGALGVGHGPVALVLTAAIAVLVGYLAVTRKDVEDPRQAAALAAPAGRRRAEPRQSGYPDERYAGQYPDERYAGQYPEGPYPGQHPGGRYSGERHQGQRYPGDQFRGEQYRGRRHSGEQYPDERYPGQPHSAPPRSAPARSEPPPPRPPTAAARALATAGAAAVPAVTAAA
jgi:hypothetical protein